MIPGNRNSLTNNTVLSLLFDHDGTLWVGTTGGICEYNRTNETFRTFLPDSSRVSSTSNQIVNIYQDSKNRIWLLTADGIFNFDKTTGRIEREYHEGRK